MDRGAVVHRRGPPPGWDTVEPAPTVVGGWRQRFMRYSRPVALYRQHDRLAAEWRRYSEFGSTDQDEQNRLGRAEFLRQTRDHMRSLGIEPPELPAELAHIETTPSEQKGEEPDA